MTRFAIDPPTLIRLVEGAAEGEIASRQLVAPSSVRSRALELLLAQVRSGRRSAADALRLHEVMTACKIRVLGDRVSRRAAWDLAIERAALVQDAEYVAVARLQADALVTADPVLRDLANGVVRIAPYRELFSG